MKNKNFGRKRQAIYILSNRKSTRIIKTLMDFFFFIKVKIKMVCFSVPQKRHLAVLLRTHFRVTPERFWVTQNIPCHVRVNIYGNSGITLLAIINIFIIPTWLNEHTVPSLQSVQNCGYISCTCPTLTPHILFFPFGRRVAERSFPFSKAFLAWGGRKQGLGEQSPPSFFG